MAVCMYVCIQRWREKYPPVPQNLQSEYKLGNIDARKGLLKHFKTNSNFSQNTLKNWILYLY